MEKGEFTITDDSGKFTTKNKAELLINTSITIAGTDTELPIKIIGDFTNIPTHLHQVYYEAMVYNYKNSIAVYDNVEPPKPPKDRIFREPSWLETLTFGLYKTKKYLKR